VQTSALPRKYGPWIQALCLRCEKVIRRCDRTPECAIDYKGFVEIGHAVPFWRGVEAGIGFSYTHFAEFGVPSSFIRSALRTEQGAPSPRRMEIFVEWLAAQRRTDP